MKWITEENDRHMLITKTVILTLIVSWSINLLVEDPGVVILVIGIYLLVKLFKK